jgi:hypothetical protein
MFHSNLAKRCVTIQLDADWTPYTDAIPQGSIPLGIATVDDITGALIWTTTHEYWLITPYYQRNGHYLHKLNQRRVRAAIHQAQTPIEPDDPEPSAPPPDPT